MSVSRTPGPGLVKISRNTKAHMLFAEFVTDSLAPIYPGQRIRSNMMRVWQVMNGAIWWEQFLLKLRAVCPSLHFLHPLGIPSVHESFRNMFFYVNLFKSPPERENLPWNSSSIFRGIQWLGESRLGTPPRVLGNHTCGGETRWLHGRYWCPTLCFKSKTGTNV